MVTFEAGMITGPLLTTLDQAGIGVSIVAVQRQQLRWSYLGESAARRLGYTAHDATSLEVLSLVAPSDTAKASEFLRMLRAGEMLPDHLELALLHRDGHPIQCEFSVGLSPIPDGVAVIALWRDLVEQHAQNASQFEGERLAIVATLVSGVAHELNNPLAFLLLHLHNIQRALADVTVAGASELRQMVAEASTGAERIRALVRALRTFSAAKAEVTMLDMVAVVEDAMRLTRPTIEARARVLMMTLPVAPLLGSEARFGLAAVSMLLFAANRFSDEEIGRPLITVTVEMRESMIVVEVTDNGADVVTETNPRLLSNCRAVALEAGGTFNLGRRPGGGVIATMSLPSMIASSMKAE
jgi:signal transduction histidine kinase